MKSALRVLVSITMLAIALYLLDWASLRDILTKINPYVFLLAIVLTMAQFLILGVRWYYIVNKTVKLPFIKHIENYFCAVFLNSFTPANIGGDVYRILKLKNHSSGSLAIFVLLLRERIIGLLSYLLFCIVCLVGLWLINPNVMSVDRIFFVYVTILVLLGAIIILASPFFIPRLTKSGLISTNMWLSNAIDQVYKAFIYRSFIDFLYMMAISGLSLLIWFATVLIIALSLDFNISWLALGAIIVLVELIRLVPISAQGIGVREASFAFLVTKFGDNPEKGFVIGLVSYLALSVAILLSGVMGYVIKIMSNLAKKTKKGCN